MRVLPLLALLMTTCTSIKISDGEAQFKAKTLLTDNALIEYENERLGHLAIENSINEEAVATAAKSITDLAAIVSAAVVAVEQIGASRDKDLSSDSVTETAILAPSE